MNEYTIFRFLFRLAADARRIPRDKLLQRLVTGLANFYNATTVKLYLASPVVPAAMAADDETFADLEDADRQRMAAIEALLVQKARAAGRFATALDLEGDEQTENFLQDTLHVMDVFAFPITAQDDVLGVLLLYLPTESKPLDEADIQALAAIGEVLRVAGEAQVIP